MPRKKSYNQTDVYYKRVVLQFPTNEGQPIEFLPELDIQNIDLELDIDTLFNRHYHQGLNIGDIDNINLYKDYSVKDAQKGIFNVLNNLDVKVIQGINEEFEELTEDELYNPDVKLKSKNKPLRNIAEIGIHYLTYTKACLEKMFRMGNSTMDFAFLDQEKLMTKDIFSPNNAKIKELYDSLTLDKMLDIYVSKVNEYDLLRESEKIASKAPVLNKRGYMQDPSKADEQNLEEALDAYNTVSNIRARRGFFWKVFNPMKNSREKQALKSIEDSLKNYGVDKDTLDLAKSIDPDDLVEAKTQAKELMNDLYINSTQFNNLVLDSKKQNFKEMQYGADQIIRDQQQQMLQDRMQFGEILKDIKFTGNKEVRKAEIDSVSSSLTTAINIYKKYQEANKERQDGGYSKLVGLSAAELSSFCSDMEKYLFSGFLNMNEISSLREGKDVNINKVVKNKFEERDIQIEEQKTKEVRRGSVFMEEGISELEDDVSVLDNESVI